VLIGAVIALVALAFTPETSRLAAIRNDAKELYDQA